MRNVATDHIAQWLITQKVKKFRWTLQTTQQFSMKKCNFFHLFMHLVKNTNNQLQEGKCNCNPNLSYLGWRKSSIFVCGSECASNGNVRRMESRRALITRIHWFFHQVLSNVDAKTWKVPLNWATLKTPASSSSTSEPSFYGLKVRNQVHGGWRVAPISRISYRWWGTNEK